MTDSSKLKQWWTFLRALAVFNVLLWALLCLPLARASGSFLQVVLSGVYVAVCAYRSWLPRIDLERYCLVDTPWSSMLLGRCAATIAEICYGTQVALCLHQLGVAADVPFIVAASYCVVPPLVLAQCFCWYSVITLSHLGHAVEECLWTGTMGLVGLCSLAAAPRLQGHLFWFAVAGAALALSFVVFMIRVDVPMYIARWRRGRRQARPYLGLRDGLKDAWKRRVPTQDWSIWRAEVAWLTGYFSVAVWLSMSFVHFSVP